MESPVKVWRNQKKTRELLGSCGSVHSWTIIRVPPAGFESQAPYPVAVVKLDSGKTITVQFVDWLEEHLVVGQRIILVLRRICEPSLEGVIVYGLKARPL